MMNTKKFLTIAMMVLGGAFAVCQAQVTNTTVSQLEDDIQYHEDVVDDLNDSIAAIDSRIALLKQKLDSINNEAKEVKNQISALEKEKKAFQRDIKEANKARQITFATRDNMVFEQDVQDVLLRPYNKLAVEEALKSFEAMETKDVLKKKSLVENYGRYTQELRKLLDDFRPQFEKVRWHAQAVDSEVVKKFHKALKGCSYYKVYDKGVKNVKNPSIPHLDKVIEEILILERQGFNSSMQYDRVTNMLYGTN